VNRVRQYGQFAILRLAGDEPSIYEVGGMVALCEPYRLQGDKIFFLADASIEEQKSTRQHWFAGHRMKPELARYQLLIEDVQILWLSEIGPLHAMMLGYCEPHEVMEPKKHEVIMYNFHSAWDRSYAKMGKGVAVNPRVEYVSFRLCQGQIPAHTGAEAECALP
jgi:hypothetical protein